MTKSYNYTPTHFLYSSLLFFLLIFMHQQTYCHTLPKPFFKIFLFRIYAPTVQTRPHHIDPVFTETSVSGSTNTHTHTTHTNQSTNDTAHTLHKYHTHTAPTNTHTTPPRPPTLTLPTQTQTLTPSHREVMPYTDVVAAPMQSQSDRPDRQDQATAAIGQARQTGSDWTRPDQKQARPD